MENLNNKFKAFTLIELLITLVIIGILAAIAYPTYIHLQYRAHRADGQIALLNTAGYIEQYYNRYNTYIGVSMNQINAPVTSPKGFYQITIPENYLTPTTYIILAIPQKAQQNDEKCGVLAINNLGQKGREINGEFVQDIQCWE